MKTLTFINSNNSQMTFSNAAPYLLQKLDDSEGVDLYRAKSMLQDGETYLGNTLNVRDISLEIALIAKTEQELAQYRNAMNKVFNPKTGEGWLVYKDDLKERKVKCIVNKLPFFSVIAGRASKGLISLTAANPFWLDSLITSEQIAVWIGGMNFPFRFPVRFAVAGEPRINIINNGDAETPIEIVIIGPCANPAITNQTTGEYIKINRVVLAGETLIVTTDFGNKRIELNGVNVFNTIDLGSTFFSLNIADNIIEVTTDNINDNPTVKINYQNRYLGV